MTENDIFKMLYMRHKKMKINLAEACRHGDFGMSYSKASKLFGGKDSLPESIILKNKILPKWEKNISGQKQWSLIEVAKWLLLDMEGINDK